MITITIHNNSKVYVRNRSTDFKSRDDFYLLPWFCILSIEIDSIFCRWGNSGKLINCSCRRPLHLWIGMVEINYRSIKMQSEQLSDDGAKQKTGDSENAVTYCGGVNDWAPIFFIHSFQFFCYTLFLYKKLFIRTL